MNIHNKINVISQCQDAIKILNGATKSGRFILKENVGDTDNISHGRRSSPLKTIKVVRFQYTSKQGNGEKLTVGICLNKLMTALGKECVFDASEVHKGMLSKGNDATSPYADISDLSTRKELVQMQVDAFTQTENSTCEECKRRNGISLINTDTQTNKILYHDVSCQVEAIEYQNSQPNLQRQHSLASLTPAQLLSCEDYFGAKRKRYSELAPDVFSRRADRASGNCVPYNDEGRTFGSQHDRISSNILFNRDRPQFFRTFRPKSVPFSNFDPSLNLTLPSASVCKYK